MKKLISNDTKPTSILWVLGAFCGLLSMASLFACSPLTPKKIDLGSQLRHQTGLIGYWNFDETTLGTAPGGSDFADSSGAGHPGTATGTLSLGTKGEKKTAVTSNGSGGVVIPIDLSEEKIVSLSYWINQHIDSVNTQNLVYEYSTNSSSQNGFLASLDTNIGALGMAHAFLFSMHGDHGTLANTAPTLPISWHFVITTTVRIRHKTPSPLISTEY